MESGQSLSEWSKVGAEIVFCFLCVCLFFITTMDSGKDGVFRG